MNPRFLVVALVLLTALLAATPASSDPGQEDEFARLVTDKFDLEPGSDFQTFEVDCPLGYSAIVGTLQEIPPGVAVGTSIASGPHGHTWTFEVMNSTSQKIAISVQVRCVDNIVFKQKSAEMGVDPGTPANGKVSCPNGYRAIGRGEHVSGSGPPDDDDFAAFFSVYLAVLDIDELDIGIDDALAAFDYYEYVICGKAKAADDKAAGKRPKLKTKTVKGSVDAEAFNFGQVDLKCPHGYSPTTPSWGPLPDKVKGFADIPGTKTTQPVRFLNGSPDKQHLEASLLCITVR